ncbi:hypothetical protein GpartN1_g6412.t1 [Galdieria partita]|uniref:tRNA (adenine(58)-N(1))-methyltransferase n=1 Tax=Galdieria partita TaxID=83374 RepID=A0A9C7UT17_9RHOD|nr:hypothetical protein GpartN1_g6412.t1 [Galdieria partita]
MDEDNHLRKPRQLERVCSEGDLIIVYISADQIKSIVLNLDTVIVNKYGKFYASDLIGKTLGRKWYSRTVDKKGRRGYVYPLWPTPELWTKSIMQRTQLVYSSDIGLIIHKMGLGCGSSVIEAGTGSGSMTFALATTVYPGGHVFSFDSNEERVSAVKSQMDKLYFGSCVSFDCRDIAEKGFGEVGPVDGIFLDIPEPWLVVKHVVDLLRDGGTVVFYSPCMEQVLRTIEEVNLFHRLKLIQILTTCSKPYETRPRRVFQQDATLLNFLREQYPQVEETIEETKADKEATVMTSAHAYRYYRSHTAYLTWVQKLLINGQKDS